MANGIVKHDYNNTPIRQRTSDDYVCLTDLAQSEGRRVGDFLDLPRTQEYISALAKDLSLLPENLVIKGRGRNGSTYGHPELAMKMAQWVSIPCEIWANRTLVRVVKEQSQSQQTQLPPADIRIVSLLGSLKDLGVDLDNPRFNQHIQDFVLNKILGVAPSLEGDKEQWAGVAEVAEEMGYPIALVTRHRSPLGKFVAAFDLTRKSEKRFCNGQNRSINLYLVCDELKNAIAEFMDAKVLSTAI